jgi:hypothetical protein
MGVVKQVGFLNLLVFSFGWVFNYLYALDNIFLDFKRKLTVDNVFRWKKLQQIIEKQFSHIVEIWFFVIFSEILLSGLRVAFMRCSRRDSLSCIRFVLFPIRIILFKLYIGDARNSLLSRELHFFCLNLQLVSIGIFSFLRCRRFGWRILGKWVFLIFGRFWVCIETL